MAGVNFTVDTTQLNQMHVFLANARGQFGWITAAAMTAAAKSSRNAISREILPMVKGGATPWTKRGLIVKFAAPNDLTAMVGFQYGEGKWQDDAFTRKAGGIPAGRYMGTNASGGDRRPKAFELQLRRAGAIERGDYVIPFSGWSRLDPEGNLPGGAYKQILSRLRANTTEGSEQNAPRGAGSRGRSGRKRSSVDFFLARGDEAGISRWQIGTQPLFIAERVGSEPKGGTGKGSDRKSTRLNSSHRT